MLSDYFLLMIEIPVGRIPTLFLGLFPTYVSDKVRFPFQKGPTHDIIFMGWGTHPRRKHGENWHQTLFSPRPDFAEEKSFIIITHIHASNILYNMCKVQVELEILHYIFDSQSE